MDKDGNKDDNENIFCLDDYRGKNVIFTKKKWQEKQFDHPELHKETFIDCLKRAIIKPDEVWPDFADSKCKRCYYKKYSATSYAKAIIWIKNNPCSVVTAFETDYIKENNYPNLKKIL